jgi:hypothetical protein
MAHGLTNNRFIRNFRAVARHDLYQRDPNFPVSDRTHFKHDLCGRANNLTLTARLPHEYSYPPKFEFSEHGGPREVTYELSIQRRTTRQVAPRYQQATHTYKSVILDEL